MLSINSSRKRITISNNIKSPNPENNKKNSIKNNFKRYKSQEAYLSLINKYSTTGKQDGLYLNKLDKLVTNVINQESSGNNNYELNSHLNHLQLSLKKEITSTGLDSNASNSRFNLIQNDTEKITTSTNKLAIQNFINESDTEEYNNNIDECDSKDLDEMKSSEVITDFYTNSISEANSVHKKEKKLINILPQPFVKQIKNKFVNHIETLEIENLEQDSQEKFKNLINEEPIAIQSNINSTKIGKQIVSNKIKNFEEPEITTIFNSVKKSIQNIKICDNSLKRNSENISIPSLKADNKCDEDIEKSIKTEKDAIHRKFLMSAKKGDREALLETLEKLNELDGDINFQDEIGWTALHYASDEGNLKIVEILINSYVDLNFKTNNKKIPLHLAASHGYFDISKLLVENGCLVNSPDDEKNTPIHICSSIGHLELLKFFLDRFPQADAKNIYGKSPLDLAKKEEIKSLIQEYLKKNESVYHRVPIVQLNKKAVRNLFKNMNIAPNISSSNAENNNLIKTNQIPRKSTNTKQISPSPANNNPQKTNIETIKSNHNKYRSIDIDKNMNQLKAINQLGKAFKNNNINININTNINNPKGPVSVVNLHTPLKDSSVNHISLTDKVNVNSSNKKKTEYLSNAISQSNVLSKKNSLKMQNISTDIKRNSTNTHIRNGLIKTVKNFNKINNSESASNKNKDSKNLNKISNNDVTYLSNNNQKKENLNYTANSHLNKISNNDVTYLSNNNQKKENINYTANSLINKRNLTNRSNSINTHIKITNSKTSRNVISCANKVEIDLASSNFSGKKINIITKDAAIKKTINKSNNQMKNTVTKESNKTKNRISDTSQMNNSLNRSDLTPNKVNLNKYFEEESTINKIEENIPNEENSITSNKSQTKINDANNSSEMQSSKLISMEDSSSLQNAKSYSLEEKTGAGEFICHALLGKGSFGEVYLVEKKNTNIIYAMKVLSKDKIMGQNLVKYAMTERNVLSVTNHPFIVKLNYSFQTSDKLFLILDYCPGGDLALHLERENRFSEDRSKIYICEIILALEDLHKRDIIFRDLKPDNVVIDSEGHALLTDFGLSKEGVMDSKSAKSFCGSIAYLAPEMLKRNGHGKAVDWYLLGVLFYEMLVGMPPYFTNNKDQLFKNIERAELQIPKFVSDGAANILKALLQRNPLMRLGSGITDAEEVKRHEYFDDVNWDSVYNRNLKPPIPQVSNRILQKFSQPRVFNEASNNNNLFLNHDLTSHFDGWSFVNNTSNQQTQYIPIQSKLK